MSVKISKPGWHFSVIVDGDDLVVENTTATWFGGDNDPHDDGRTASGILTKGNPGLHGCALPMNYQGPSAATRKAVGGSPLPMMPYYYKGNRVRPGGISVIVTHKGNSLAVPLIDLGPARWTKDGIDLTRATFKTLGGHMKQGVIPVSYRVLGGAKYLECRP